MTIFIKYSEKSKINLKANFSIKNIFLVYKKFLILDALNSNFQVQILITHIFGLDQCQILHANPI